MDIKLTCKSDKIAQEVYDMIYELGFCVMYDKDTIYAYNLGRSEVVLLRSTLALKYAQNISVTILKQGRKVVESAADNIVIPAIKDTIASTFEAKDWLYRHYSDIKENPREHGNWEPAKESFRKLKAKILRR